MNFGGGRLVGEADMHQSLRFCGSSNRYDPHIFGTRLTGEFVSSNIVALGYATRHPPFVFAIAGFGCQCRPLQRINRVTLTFAFHSELGSGLWLGLEVGA